MSVPLILVVCRANVCRSPLAAELLRRRLGAAALRVESAGVAAHPGTPMCTEAAQWARVRSQITETLPTATELTVEQLEEAALILAADAEVRAECAMLAPSCRLRLFTLRQAAYLVSRVDATQSLAAFAEALDDGRVLLAGLEDEDIVDRHGSAPHPEVFAEVDAAVEALARGLSRAVV